MKPFLLTLICITISSGLFAQAPQKMNYQGVARDNAGNVLGNQNIALRLSVLSGSINGTEQYVETQSASTSDLGLFSILIGDGTAVSGAFSEIEWGSTSHFLKVEMDPNGGTNYTLMGTSELVSVPHAFYADKVGSIGQGFESHYGTGSPQFWNSTANNYTSINGLDEIEFTLAEDMTVLFHTNGSASMPVFNAWASISVAIFIDGTMPAEGAEQRLHIVTDDNISTGGSVWSITYPASLSAGTHTVSVKARSNGTQNQGTVGISSNTLYDPKPALQLIFLKN